MRDYKLYLDDILKAINKIEKYTKKIDSSQFKKDELLIDAIARNLEIIGEAVKNIPANVKKSHSEFEWKKIAGLRDILAHEYFGIDTEVMWDIIKNKLPKLKNRISRLLKSSK
ncbi:MAG: DUF86 domain-containing protein [Candidatus Omnitrophica bacterium]|nr:DUF86 domain-containing protein [Candidatus Omnitrophota bacterium]